MTDLYMRARRLEEWYDYHPLTFWPCFLLDMAAVLWSVITRRP